MNDTRLRSFRSQLFSGVLAACCFLPTMAFAGQPQTVTLEDFESSDGGAVAVTTSNSSAAANSNSVVSHEVDSAGGRLKLTDPDGGTNGAVITIPGGIPEPGYYLFTADVKVDNASAPIRSYGMAIKAGGATTAKVSDTNAGYVMNLTGSGDAQLGFQTIGAALNVPAGGSFPQDVTIYFGANVSGNSYSSPQDGAFVGTHRAVSTAAWAANSSNAVFIDDIKRIGPGSMGEERHLWISVGDNFTNLANLEDALVRAKANNFTAVDILARYRADAYYVPNRTDATYPNPEPFGTRIGVPVSRDNDPLQYCIDRCRELGLKVYISFSAFLVTPNSTYPSTLPADSVMWYQPATGAPRPMVPADDANEGLWADFGRKDVRDYTKNILMDIVMNYDIDGVVFDRVRYPGSRFGYNPQALTEMGYGTPPSPFSAQFRTDRRDAAADFIQECYEEITTRKPWIVVGATPIAFGTSMVDTYNGVFQHWPTWTSRKVANRVVDFGIIDLLQPQFYRLISSGAPGSNKTLMQKTIFGDVATDPNDYGVMPGAYSMLAPLLYHPTQGDAAMSRANSQNMIDTRLLDLNGFGLFPAIRTLNDMGIIRDPASNSAGVDVLASPAPKTDYLFKAGYDTIGPNAVVNFSASPQSRGSVTFTWDTPAPAADGELPARYEIYRSTSQPVKETYANLVTKTPVTGNWFHAPVGEAGNYFYKIVPIDDYNNRGEGTTIGPFTVGGLPQVPADVIVDDVDAELLGAWSVASTSADKYGPTYSFAFKGTGSRTAKFTATIPVSGQWVLSEWHPQGTNRATDARHQVQHDGGTSLVNVNQTVRGGQWNEIGTYNFTAGNSYSVTIDDNFNGAVVMADAFKWSYVYAPTVPPAAPTNLTAVAGGSSSVQLTWNDNSSDELGFEIERTICGGTTVIIPVPANTTSFTDTGLAQDTEYKYIIRAWKTGSQSAESNLASVRTLPQVDDIIVDDQLATFTGPWTTSSSGNRYGPTFRFVSKVDAPNRKAVFSFTPTRTAVYEIGEWFVAGANRAANAKRHVEHAGGTDLVVINQQPLANGSQWFKLGQWLFQEGQTYKLTMTNDFTVGDVMVADAIRITYKDEPPTSPAAPSNLVATAISHEEVGLTWSDNAVNESSYEIIRTKAGGQPEVVAALAADSVSYIDTGLEALTQYTYVVRAVNSQGNSPNSNVATVTTLSSTPPDQIIDNRNATIVGLWTVGTGATDKWEVNYHFRSKTPTGANRAVFNFTTRDHGLYEIYEWHPAGANRAGDAQHIIEHQYGAASVIVNQQVRGGSWNSLGVYTFAEGGQYSVSITDKFTIGDSVMADGIKVVWVGEAPAEGPTAPSNLTAQADGASRVDLSWTPGAASADAVEVLRNGIVIAKLAASAAAFSDSAVTECTQYNYVVRTVKYGRPSESSNAVQVVLDATAPEITAPDAVSVNTDAGSSVATGINIGQAEASDNCTGDITITNNAPLAFPVGQTIVTWTATDAKGNSASADQIVTVSDTEAPFIVAPEDVTVIANITGCFAADVELGSPVTSDNTGVASVSNDAPTTYPVGTTVVTWTVADNHGNSSTAQQNVVVSSNPAQAPASSSAVAQAWNKVLVTWSDSSNETLYEVRFATNASGPYTVAGSTGAGSTSFLVEDLLPNTTYYFVVEARNACGSADSPVSSAKTPLFTGGSDQGEGDDSWEVVEDENAEGGSYLLRARRSSDNAAAWNFTVPVSGTYRVEVFIPTVNHLSTQANYKVTNGVTSKTTVINQRKNTGKWVLLDDYQFVAGSVTVNVFQPNNSVNPVVVDALRVNQIN